MAAIRGMEVVVTYLYDVILYSDLKKTWNRVVKAC